MPKLRSKGKRLASIVLEDGSVLFHTGIISDADFSGVILSHTTLKRLGFCAGDYLQIELDDRGTIITRKLACADCAGYSGLLKNYVYMDPQSAHYLEAAVCDVVRVRPAQCQLAMP